jgi:hypothetical protein
MVRRFYHRIIFFIILCCFSLLAHANPKPVLNHPRAALSQSTPTHQAASWNQFDTLYYLPRLELGVYALHDGTAHNATLLEGFLPLLQRPNAMIFGDIRLFDKEGTPFEGNVALGWRYLNSDQGMLGVYGSYDRMRSGTRNYFNQTTVGVEAWIHRVFLGSNAYIPFGTTLYDNDALNVAALTPTGTDQIFNVIYFAGSQRILPGVDAMVGIDLLGNSHHTLTVYGGGYYFHRNNVATVCGSKLKAAYTVFSRPGKRLWGLLDRIQIEGEMTHDHIRETNWYLGVRLGIDIGRPSKRTLTRLEHHMADPIFRDMNEIAVDYTENASSFLKNSDGSKVEVAVPRTYSDFVSFAEGAAGVNIIGINGTLTGPILAPTLTLTRDQVISGGGYAFTIDGRPYSVTVGNQGELSGNTSNDLLTINSGDMRLQNMALSNNDPDGGLIDSDNDGSLTINNVQMSGVLNHQDTYLLHVSGSGLISMNDAHLTNTGAGGLLEFFPSATSDMNIDGGVFSGDASATPLIRFDGAGGNVISLNHTTITNTNASSTGSLVEVDDNTTFSNTNITLENAGSGGDIDIVAGTLYVTGSIMESSVEPIYILEDSANILFENATVNNTDRGCIVNAKANSGDVTIIDSTFSAAGAEAVFNLAGTGDVTFEGASSIGNTGSGDLMNLSSTSLMTFGSGSSVTLTHSGAGDGIVLSSTSAVNQDWGSAGSFTLTGNINSGQMIVIPDGSAESLSIQEGALSNSSGGSILGTAGSNSGTVTLTDSSLSASGSGSILSLAGSADVTVDEDTGTTTLTNTGSGNLISLEGNSGTLSVTGTSGNLLDLTANTGKVLVTDGSSFGTLNLDYIHANAPLSVELTAASATGTVDIQNSTFTINNWHTSGADMRALAFTTDLASQTLTISNFANNSITLNDTLNQELYGVYIDDASSATNITLTNGMDNNLISIDNSSTASSPNRVVGLYTNYVSTTNSGLTNNDFEITAKAGSSNTGGNGAYGYYSTGELVHNGDFSGNRYTITNSTGSGIGWWLDSGTTTLTGSINGNNEFTISNNGTFAFGIGADSNLFSIFGDIASNTFLYENNGNQAAAIYFRAGTINVSGGFINNNIDGSNNVGLSTTYGLFLRQAGGLTFSDGFKNNVITLKNNGRTAVGMDLSSSFNNIFSLGEITGNTFIIENNPGGNGSTAIQVNNTDVTTNLTIGKVENNNFTVANNSGSNRVFRLYDWVTFTSTISNNTFNLSSTGIQNMAFDVQASDGETINFEDAVSSNTFNISGGTSVNLAFRLRTAGTGVVNFDGNSSAAELSSSNGGAAVNADVGSYDVNFLG